MLQALVEQQREWRIKTASGNFVGTGLAQQALGLAGQLKAQPPATPMDAVLKLLFEFAGHGSEADMKIILGNCTFHNPNIIHNPYLWCAYSLLTELSDRDIETEGGVLAPVALSFKGHAMQLLRATETEVLCLVTLFCRLCVSFLCRKIDSVELLRTFVRIHQVDFEAATLQVSYLFEHLLNCGEKGLLAFRRARDPANAIDGLTSATAAQITKAVGMAATRADEEEKETKDTKDTRKRPRSDEYFAPRCHKCNQTLGEGQTSFADHRLVCPRRHK